MKRLLLLIGLLFVATSAHAQAVVTMPSSLNFGNGVVAITSPPQTITVTNSGTSTLTFTTDPILSGVNVSDFALSSSGTCKNTVNVAPNGSCTIILTFTPGAAGARSGIVSISDNAAGSPHSTTLSGTGLANGNNQITLSCPATANCKIVGQITMSMGSSGGTPPTPASVSISPMTGSVLINGTFPIVATVANDPNKLGVTWTISGPTCTGASCGTVSPTTSASGATVTYTAPPTSPGSIFITATAVANQSSAQTNITVITPTPPPVGPTGVNVFTPSCAHSGTITTCAFTGYSGPTMIVNLTPVTTASTVTGVQACISGSACQNLTLVGSVSGVYQFRGISVGAGFNQVKVTASDTNQVNVAISDTANVGAFDTFNTKTGAATTNPTGPSITTATANELVVCALDSSGTTTAAASPFVFNQVGNKDGYAAVINPTASAISPSWTTTSGTYAALCGAYSVGTTPPAITVVNNPVSVNVQSSNTQQFTAIVGNDPANLGVDWTCTSGGGSCGSFSPTHTASNQATTWTAPALVPPGASITQLQNPVPHQDVSGNPATIAISSSAAGSTLCVADVWNTATGTVAFTDSKGETWGAPVDSAVQSGSSGAWDCLPNNVGGVGSITATVTGASPTNHELHVIELSGLLTSNIIDQFIHANTFASPMDSGFALATTNANDYLFGFGFNGASSNFTAGNDGQGDNYTKLSQLTFIGSAIEGFNAVSATNTYKATMTPSAASGSVMFFGALKGSTGSGSGNANITITATSTADGTKTANSTVTLTAAPPPISVVVNQSGSTLTAGSGTISITPTVSNDTAPTPTVNWTLNGLGSISLTSSASGVPTVYTPPASVSTATSVTVTATSVTDNTKSAVATILVNPPTGGGGGSGTVTCSPNCPAFTGAGGTAQGSAAATKGGSGGQVFLVTNLADSGSGSLRACAQASGPRICIFRVSGMIRAASRLQVNSPNLTVAGQTAPGGGIVLKEVDGCSASGGCGIPFTATHDVIWRYLTYDGSAATPTGPDTGTVGFETTSGNDFNIIYDHISCRWWGNACIDIFSNGPDPGGTAKTTVVQWSLFYEPNIAHAIIIKSDTTSGSASAGTNRDYHHNMAVNYSRRWGLFNNKSCRWVNNLSYNGLQSGSEDFYWLSWGGINCDFIGNKYVGGPQTNNTMHTYLFQSNPCSSGDPGNNCPSDNPGPPSIYMLNNIGPICQQNVTQSCQPTTLSTATSAVNDSVQKSQTFQGWEGGETPHGGSIPIAPVPDAWYRNTPLAASTFPIVPDPVTNLDAILIPTVGNSQHLDCQGNFVNYRDSQDSRVIAEYQNKGSGGNFGNHNNDGNPQYSPNYNGPLPPNNAPSIPAGTPCPMTFVTGIYDGWLQKYGLPTNDPTLGNKIDPKSGYTYEDDFLDGIIPTKPN